MSQEPLALLDASFYPQCWDERCATDALALLHALLQGDVTASAEDIAARLLEDSAYREWIYFSVFGRYLQRSFDAFYRQSEDSFNSDMPDLFRAELMRHARPLAIQQQLFMAGALPEHTRSEKLLTATVNPATAIRRAQMSVQPVINHITITGKNVAAFPIRHNRRTSERIRNEVLILDFRSLRLVSENMMTQVPVTVDNKPANAGFWQRWLTPKQKANEQKTSKSAPPLNYCIRHYELR